MVSKKSNQTPRVVTTTSTIRFEQPVSSRGQKKAKAPTVLVVPAGEVVEHVGGFVSFIREHAIVGLAVGFIIGAQVQGLVKDLTTVIITPLVSLMFDNQDLRNKTFTLGSAKLGWGLIAYDVINFLLLLAVVYAMIKILKLDKLDKKKEKD